MIKEVRALTSALFIAVLAACAGTPSAPVAQNAAPTQTAQADESKSTVRVCQTDDATGSHLRKQTVCVTEEEERANREFLQRTQGQRHSGAGSSGF